MEAVRARASVVVGVDFSEGAMLAFREGRWLSRRAGLGLQVVHVADDDLAWQPDAGATAWLREASLDPGLMLVRQGLPWVEIVRHALEVSSAVVVLGSHGASGPQAMTLGSTASRVAMRAPCPVLFVSQRREHMPYTEIAVPSQHPLQEHP
ncbi:MAG TPA: universal stress protein [Longimicrobiales bacterium]|nr:universal stress protein [Longimicrobiales bacterium]